MTRLGCYDDERLRSLVLREMFSRSRRAVLIGAIPVLLIAAAHVPMVPMPNIATWSLGMVVLLTYRFLLASAYLGGTLERGGLGWLFMDIGVSAMIGAGWGSMFWVLAVPEQPAVLYLHTVFVTGAITYVLSSVGIFPANYLAYLIGPVLGLSTALHLQVGEPGLATIDWTLQIAAGLYALIMLMRSFDESRRVTEAVANRLELAEANARLRDAIGEEKQARTALEQQHAYIEKINAALAELTVRDPLTRLYNRRHLDEALDTEIARARRLELPLSAILIDIDHFKRINDTAGHAGGDEVLCRTADVLGSGVRLTDTCGRWGGEEFLCLLPDTDSDGAFELAERLRVLVASQSLGGRGRSIKVTASFGVASLQGDEIANRFMARADAALYRAKAAGRNRVMAAEAGEA